MSHTTHIHRIARVLIKPIINTPVRPNHVTTVRLLTGIAAAGCLGVGHAPWPAIGAGIFLFSVVLDRADGELARLTNTRSPGGHIYDLISDAICNALILIGLGIGLRHGSLGDMAIAYGLIAGVSVSAILWMVIQMESMSGERAAELPGFAGFDLDDLVILIPVGVWLGWSQVLLIAGTIIAPIVAIVFVIMLFRIRRKAQPPRAID
ncbi:MAG: CDP-alcohol phosphatidyltransferase family protein [Rhodospirillales bacterium]